MRLLRYLILACLMISIIGDDEAEDKEEGPESDEKLTQPTTLQDSPVSRKFAGAKNTGGQVGLRQRCNFKPDQTNCAGHSFPRRWVYNSDTDTCEPIHLPVCWNKTGVFSKCKRCMKACIRNKKGAMWRRPIRQFCRKSANAHWKGHSLN
uniref:Putative monolaris n=1 Tax=Rhipicephalus pulchellus TaxID=72859 RepID=L7LSU1_RHIPC